jgi:hypothetical protein
VEIALIITAAATLITALAGAAVLIIAEIRKVHKIVNQQRTDMLKYQDRLIGTLRAAGLHVPDDESLH